MTKAEGKGAAPAEGGERPRTFPPSRPHGTLETPGFQENTLILLTHGLYMKPLGNSTRSVSVSLAVGSEARGESWQCVRFQPETRALLRKGRQPLAYPSPASPGEMAKSWGAGPGCG